MNFSVKIPNRIDFLLIVRGVAAISVIYWHLGGDLTRDEYFASFFIVPGSRLTIGLEIKMATKLTVINIG
jgi:peptidoglycan/LPS O-acetylase OafA/YrhL